MTKYDVKRVPRELLEKFAEQLIVMANDKVSNPPICMLTRDSLDELAKAATAPLRTRAQVDADIVELVKACAYWTSNYCGPGGKINYMSAEFDRTVLNKGCKWPGQKFVKVLAGLLDEETSD